MVDEGVTMQGIECRYVWHADALIAAFDFIACASEQVPSIDPRNRNNDNVLGLHVAADEDRNGHFCVSINMSAWPEGEAFGEWFTEWADKWRIAVAD